MKRFILIFAIGLQGMLLAYGQSDKTELETLPQKVIDPATSDTAPPERTIDDKQQWVPDMDIPPDDINVKKQEKLIKFILKGNKKRADKLVQSGLYLNYKNAYGITALHAAAMQQDADTTSLLVNNGASIDIQDSLGRTPLYYAVENADSFTTSILTKAGANPVINDNDGSSPLELLGNFPADHLGNLLPRSNVDISTATGDTALHIAAREGSVEHIKALINLGANTRLHNKKGLTALDILFVGEITLSKAQCISILLQNGALEPRDTEWRFITEPFRSKQYNIRFEYGVSVLHIAVERAQEGLVRFLLSEGVMVDAQDQPGSTPLHVAVRKGLKDIATLLINNGADINIADYNGETALHIALYKPELKDIAKMLIGRNANIQLKNNNGSTALHLAAMYSKDVEISRMLIQKGANVNARDRNGNIPLLLTVDPLTEESEELAKLYMENGADIFAKNNKGASPISIILTQGDMIADWVLSHKTLNQKDDNGRSIIHYAALLGTNTANLKQILKLGADPNSRDYNGKTPLIYAIENRYSEQAKILIDNNASPYLEDNKGHSALITAFDKGSDFTLFILGNRLDIPDQSGNTPIYHALQWGYKEIVKALLKKGADPHHKNKRQETILHQVVRTDDLESAQLILKNGSDPNAVNVLGRTPLHIAVNWHQIGMIRLLMTRDANVNAQDKNGQTPLYYAALSGKKDVVQWLLNFHSSANIEDINGRTPLFVAAELGYVDIMELMVAANANLSARTNDGKTPLHTAILAKSDVAALNLIRMGADIFAQDGFGRTPFDIMLQRGPDILKNLMISKVINRQDNNGNTPLHLAVQAGVSPATIKILLDKGADPTFRNSRGDTAYAIARRKGNRDLIAILK